MTKLIDHITSLELSKKLKELGFPQNSLFYWVKTFEGWFLVYKNTHEYSLIDILHKETIIHYNSGCGCGNNCPETKADEIYSAYTATELINNIQIAYEITFFGNTQHTIHFKNVFYAYIPSEVNLANSIAILALKAITEYNLKPFIN